MSVEKAILNPESLPDWSDYFSQIVIVPNSGTKTIYISGQVSVDNKKNVIGKGNLAAQAVQTFQNLQTALTATGATTNDVVKVNIYVKNYKPEDARIISAAFSQFFSKDKFPTATWLGVQSLSKEDFLIEVDAIAVV